MKLQDRLDEVRRQLVEVLGPTEFRGLEGATERLRMLQLVEQGALFWVRLFGVSLRPRPVRSSITSRV